MPHLVRLAAAAEHPFLVDLWRRSVEATHDFLSPEDIDALYTEVRDLYLAAVELWVATRDGSIQGFMGIGDVADHNHRQFRKIEMLFVEPAARGSGAGSALLDFAAHRYGLLCVDVNEQNPAARGFYESKGFVARSRSAFDGQGRPFPLLHLWQGRWCPPAPWRPQPCRG